MEHIPLTPKTLAAMMDQTLLAADVTADVMADFCRTADRYGFAMVAVNSAQVRFCKDILRESAVHVGAAVGFPLGQTLAEVKVFEAKRAIQDGADEIDYVVNIGRLKSGDLVYVREEMAAMVELCRRMGAISKVIFENCYLTDPEKAALCVMAKQLRPDFVKTSTGFGSGGATAQDVSLMARLVGPGIGVKAAGGIRSYETAAEMLRAGATRIGTSRGVEIVEALAHAFDREAALV